MANLARRDRSFPQVFGSRREFDELLNRLLGETSLGIERIMPSLSEVPPVETWLDKEKKDYHARIALPGIDPQNVQLNLQGDTLSISAERKETRESKDVNYLRSEFSYGKLERTLTLPEGVDREKITAEYNNGMLEINAPIASAALPRRIEVKTAPTTKVAGA